jgi:hypothetical protein
MTWLDDRISSVIAYLSFNWDLMHYDGLGWRENGVIDAVFFFIQSLRYVIVGGGEKEIQVLFLGSYCGGCNYLVYSEF